MDYRLEQLINSPAGHTPPLDEFMSGLAAGAEGLFIGIVLFWLLAGLVLRRPRETEGALAALLAAGLALALNQVIAHLWFRPRPFVSHPAAVHLLLAHSRDASFPSDHAAAAIAISAVILARHRRTGLLAGALAVGVCYARVYVGDHYPGDVLAGAAVGTISAVTTLRLLPMLRRKWAMRPA